MMGIRAKLISGDEYDYLTRARKHYKKRARKFVYVKRAFRKRIRKQERLELTSEVYAVGKVQRSD